MKPLIFVTTMLSALAFFFQDAFCQQEVPIDRVRAILEEVMAVQTDPHLKGQEFRGKRRVAIKKIIAENFHLDRMAEHALGSHWDGMNEAGRTEFKALFHDLFLESYTKLVLDFLKREIVLYTNEEIHQNQAMVKTTITRMNEEIPVDYSLTTAEDKWVVDDVKIDGVSIVENYQKSFSRVIKQESYEALLRKMRLQRQAIEKAS